MMTREQKLYSMTMKMLVMEAEKLGVKIDKKGSKQKAVEKMLAAEQETKTAEVETAEVETAEVVEVVEEQTAEEQQETKKERKPRQKKELSQDIITLLEYIKTTWNEIGFIRYPKKDNSAFCALCAKNGRQVLKLMWTTKKVSLFTRIEAAVDFAEKWQKINYAMPFQCMFFTDTEENRQNITNLFDMVLEADGVRITKKMLKERK